MTHKTTKGKTDTGKPYWEIKDGKSIRSLVDVRGDLSWQPVEAVESFRDTDNTLRSVVNHRSFDDAWKNFR
jgi:hypothetical protein